MFPLIVLVFAAAAVVLAAPANAQAEVQLRGARWERLQPRPEAPAPGAPGITVSDRVVHLVPDFAADGAAGLAIDARWRLSEGAPAWLDLLLADPAVLVTDVRVDGVPAPIYLGPDGAHLVARLTPGAQITLLGTRPGDARRGPVPLTLLPAASGLTTVTAPPDRAPAWTGGVVVQGALWGGAARTSLQLVEPPPTASADELIAASEVALGVSASDDLLQVRGRVRLLVRRGLLDQVVLDAPGAAGDLAIAGLNVGEVSRRGDRVVVTLLRPAAHLVAFDVSWSAPLPQGEVGRLPVPTLGTPDAATSQTTLQLARSGDIEVLPELTGWVATASTELPPWARGLVDGAATASFLGTARSKGSLSLLRFVPVQGPEVMIDVAEVVLASSRGGRVLLRARYEVLNDRAPILAVRLPPGARLLSLRVGDSPAQTTYGPDGSLRVPLRRSIESLNGLLSFPVELAILVETPPWRRRDLRSVPLPTVSAPIAVLRTTAYLPPGHQPWRAARLPDLVDDFSRGEGITYGIDIRTAGDRDTVAQADQLFGQAVRAWESNSFEEADGLLEKLGALGASNENVARLQGNLDLMLNDASDDDRDAPAAAAPSRRAVVQARRVKEHAKAKAGKDEDAWEDAQREAESSYRSGDYERAEAEATRALELGRKLQRLEQDESAEVSTRNARVSKVLQEAREGRALSAVGNTAGLGPSKKKPTSSPPPPPLVATTHSVPVPEVGAPLRFQTLLLPAGSATTVTLGARAARPSQEPR